MSDYYIEIAYIHFTIKDEERGINSMIYTVTLNPALDYFVTLDKEPIDDEVNRATSCSYKAAGKGLNVSKILSILGIPSKAIALLGGFTGKYIQEQIAKDKNIEMVDFQVQGDNRINVKLHYNSKALCVNGNGPEVSKQVKQALLDYFNNINKDDYVIISGSMMRGFTLDDIIDISKVVNSRGGKLVNDMEQISIDQLLACDPWLIKPNFYEFSLLLEKPNMKKEDLEEYLMKAHDRGIGNTLLSLGKDGAVYSTKDKNYYLQQPNTLLVNKVGAGDAMLASFVGKISMNSSIEEALRYAGAAGNAVASTLQDISLQDIENYYKQMNVITKG